MPRFAGSYDETFTVNVPIEKAKEHFGDLEMIGKCYPDLKSYEVLDDKTLRFLLNPKSALNMTFQGKYDCKYEFISDSKFVWKTVGSGANMFTDGWMEFSKVGDDKTRIVYHEEMECEIPINRLLAKALKPIVNRDISSGCKEFVVSIRRSL
jgi:carbon monoxide dehydrogenase subunit G